MCSQLIPLATKIFEAQRHYCHLFWYTILQKGKEISKERHCRVLLVLRASLQIVPGQPIFLQSGQKGVLVEVPTGAYAAVVSTGGKSTAFNQSTREQRSNLPSSVLKGDARPEALQAEKEQEWVVSGLDLAQQVT